MLGRACGDMEVIAIQNLFCLPVQKLSNSTNCERMFTLRQVVRFEVFTHVKIEFGSLLYCSDM
jgi:hypothetical protein